MTGAGTDAALTRPDETSWVHFTCQVCGRNRPTWSGLYRHAKDAHGVVPRYAESVAYHQTRRRPSAGGLPVYLDEVA